MHDVVQMGIRNREAYFNLNTDKDDYDLMKYGEFYLETLFVERESMDLYKEKFNIDPLTENGHRYYPEEEQVERYAQNMAFWQKLLREYNDHDFETNRSNPRYVYIKMKEAEFRVKTFNTFNKAILRNIITRLLELVNDN